MLIYDRTDLLIFVTVAIFATLWVAVAALRRSRRLASRKGAIDPGTPDRFARVLLAEVALYKRKVAEDAWSRSAVYGALKNDIDRAREMFLSVWPASEDVFYSTLVSTLARGEPDRLGADYPYSRTSSSPPS